MREILSATLALALAGCGHTNGLLPKNDESMVLENEVLCLATKAPPEELAVESLILVPLVKAGAGFVIDKVAGAIEQESKLYKATYTARLPDKLLVSYKTDGSAEQKIKLRFNEITFARYAGDPKVTNCANAGTAEPAMRFTVRLNADSQEGNFRITPKEFKFQQSRAKVAAWDNKLDVNVQLQMLAILTDKEGRKTSSDVAKVDFPMGRVPIGKHYVADENRLKSLASGWIPLPAYPKPVGTNKPAAPIDFGAITITVTVIESDNLGDVLAKGSKSIRDDKDKLIDKLLDKLELKE